MSAKKKNLTALVFAGLVGCTLALGSGLSVAGEITGNGKWIAGSPDEPLNGKSECAYSGYQDQPGEEGFREGSLAQSWGQFPKEYRDALRAFVLMTFGVDIHPGTSCNPSRQAQQG